MQENKKQKGFTLIELLVTMFIMVTLTSVVLANYGSYGNLRSVNLARSNIVSDLRKIQSYSLSSRDIAPGVLASSYSIVFDLTSASAKQSYAIIGNDNSVPSGSHPISTVKMTRNTFLNGITVSHAGGAPVSANTLTMKFVLPYGRALASYTTSGGATVTDEVDDLVTINVGSNDTTQTANVIIDGVTGRISVQ